jgi:hypothetical protein
MRNLLVKNLSPKALFSLPVFLFSLGWGISTNLLNVVYNPSDLYLERVMILCLSHLVMFLGIFLGRNLLRVAPQLVQAVLMLPLIAMVSLMRGYTNWFMFSLIGIDSPEVLVYRVFGGLTNMGLSLTISAIAVHRLRTYTDTKQKLMQENSRLLELRKIARQQIKVSTETRVGEIRSLVLGSLSLDNAESREKSMQLITRTIDNVVRPLSQQIESEQFTHSSPSEDVKKVKLNWREAVLGALDARFINPLAVTLCTLIGAFTFISTTNTLEDTVKLLAIGAFGAFTLLTLVKWVLMRGQALLPKPAAIGLWIVLIPVPGIGVSLLTLLVTLQTSNPNSLIAIGPYFVTGLTILFALTGSSQASANQATQRLEENAHALSWEVARVAGEHRRLQRSLSHLVHGRIQGALTSSLIRLKQAVESGPASLPEVEQAIHAELVQLISSLSLDDLENIPTLETVINRVNQTWEGIAKSTLQLKEITEAEISKDVVLMTNLAELIPELAFNAIRHGKAKSIEFVIEMSEANLIRLSCLDSGSRSSDSGRVGLGTKLLDECALSWNRETTDAGTLTVLLIPHLPKESSKNSL